MPLATKPAKQQPKQQQPQQQRQRRASGRFHIFAPLRAPRGIRGKGNSKSQSIGRERDRRRAPQCQQDDTRVKAQPLRWCYAALTRASFAIYSGPRAETTATAKTKADRKSTRL